MLPYKGNWISTPEIAGTALETALRKFRGVPCSATPKIRKIKLSVFKLEMARIRLLSENSLNIHTAPSTTIRILKIGDFSSQSPGRFDEDSSGFPSSI